VHKVTGMMPERLAPPHKNSLDALRLVAAAMVLYSHQYALLGLPEPLFTPWNSFGDAGVAIFFFLSGCLVWTSWARDPSAMRFFQRRSLRIFPALWVLCLVSVLVLGPLLSVLPFSAYFGSVDTWRYLGTALLVSSKTLPGLFPGNAIPFVVNGSLWTLPVEFLCYITVAVTGMVSVGWAATRLSMGTVLSLCVLAVVVLASYGSRWTGPHFIPHLEMVALFWFGVLYGHAVAAPRSRVVWVLGAVALLAYALLGPRSMERAVMLACAALLVHVARTTAMGSRLTEPLGDLSYGVYIFAFPVQQIGVHFGRGLGWGVTTYLLLSAVVTGALAYLSWHAVEKQALRFKPASRGTA
jgi:peptidoglycan/LPS O-acetylase OafA/YrhL